MLALAVGPILWILACVIYYRRVGRFESEENKATLRTAWWIGFVATGFLFGMVAGVSPWGGDEVALPLVVTLVVLLAANLESVLAKLEPLELTWAQKFRGSKRAMNTANGLACLSLVVAVVTSKLIDAGNRRLDAMSHLPNPPE
jgi:hypothetical protein